MHRDDENAAIPAFRLICVSPDTFRLLVGGALLPGTANSRSSGLNLRPYENADLGEAAPRFGVAVMAYSFAKKNPREVCRGRIERNCDWG